MKTAERSPGMSVLVVIRGNSASGKSSAAVGVQRRLGRGRCLVVSQDVVRRQMLWERDVAGAVNVELVERIALFGLTRGMVVVVEGILDAGRYGEMLGRLTRVADRALHYCFDLSFEETVARHTSSSRAGEFSAEQMAEWYHGWQPLGFVDEVRIDSSWGPGAVVDRIHGDVVAAR